MNHGDGHCQMYQHSRVQTNMPCLKFDVLSQSLKVQRTTLAMYT